MNELTVLHTGPLGVNTYILPLVQNSVLIVDPAACAFTGDEEVITGWLAGHGKVPAGIVFTHGHFDHITGLAALKHAYPQCMSAIHADDARALGSTAISSQFPALSAMGLDELTAALQGLPAADITFCGGECLDAVFAAGIKDETANALARWEIISTPGHSKGSVCLYSASEKTLISGDTLFYHGWGRTDIGGDERELMHSLTVLRDRIPPDTLVYPGHGRYAFLFAEAL